MNTPPALDDNHLWRRANTTSATDKAKGARLPRHIGDCIEPAIQKAAGKRDRLFDNGGQRATDALEQEHDQQRRKNARMTGDGI